MSAARGLVKRRLLDAPLAVAYTEEEVYATNVEVVLDREAPEGAQHSFQKYVSISEATARLEEIIANMKEVQNLPSPSIPAASTQPRNSDKVWWYPEMTDKEILQNGIKAQRKTRKQQEKEEKELKARAAESRRSTAQQGVAPAPEAAGQEEPALVPLGSGGAAYKERAAARLGRRLNRRAPLTSSSAAAEASAAAPAAGGATLSGEAGTQAALVAVVAASPAAAASITGAAAGGPMLGNRGGVASTSAVEGPSSPAMTTAVTPRALQGHRSGREVARPALASGESSLALGQGSLGEQPQQLARRSMARERALRRAGRGRGAAAVGAAAAAVVEAPSIRAQSSAPVLDKEGGLWTEAGRSELLVGTEEKELTLMVQDLLALEAKAADLKASLGRAPSDVEWMEAVGMDNERRFAARLAQGRKAKSIMVQSNLRLVLSICRKYQGYGMALQDLMVEGIAGLLKGVERFEPTKGFKFSTYAHWWIRQAVTRSLSDQSRVVRLPVHLHELMQKVQKGQRELQQVYGHKPRLEDVAAHLGVEVDRIREMYEAMRSPVSLDAPFKDREGTTLGDTVEDEDALTPVDAVMMENMRNDMETVLMQLNPREAGVLRMRFGLVDGQEKTLEEIGQTFSVTRERIRQIEARALRILRSKQSQMDSGMEDHAVGVGDKKKLAGRAAGASKKSH